MVPVVSIQGNLIGQWWDGGQVAETLNQSKCGGAGVSMMPDKGNFGAVLSPVAIQGNLIGRDAGGPHGVGASDAGAMYTLTNADVHGVAHAAVAFAQNQVGEVRCGSILNTLNTNSNASGRNTPMVATGVFFAGQGAKAGSIAYDTDIAPTLKASDSGTNRTPSAHIGMAVRRLTPVECERLQGFPDGYTAIPWRGKPADECPDGPRYRALGNSMAVPCMRWIGERIAQVDALDGR